MSIFDPHPRDASAAPFDEVANAMLEQGEVLSPSELHGCLCGLLGGGFDDEGAAILARLEKTLDTSLHGPLADMVITLRDEALLSVTEGEFDFSLLLPEDDLELEQRIAAMAGWCRGFLSGFAEARVNSNAAAKAVATDSAEALKDFAAIAQAASDDKESEPEEREGHYLELLEYLRVAAMNVIMDARAAAAQPGAKGAA
ncbi:MAG: UPF0149 family protein [Halieaceae bacterium]|nr:UPF0149 family protein [Halieaceae bacterium]